MADKKYEYAFPMPAVTVDLVVFTIINGRLSFLAIERKNPPHRGKKALPGGFLEVDRKETLEDAAKREAFEETGLKDLFIEQLYTFSDPDRDTRGRVISCAFYCLVPAATKFQAGDDAASAAWMPVDLKGEMAFDHRQILDMAVERLKGKIAYTPIAHGLLPEKFTIPEMKVVYETILGKTLDDRNFRRYVADRGLVVPMARESKGKTRPARLFKFNHKVAKSLLGD